MHELSLMKDLMEKILTVLAEQNGNRVTGLTVQIGALAHISGDHFREHFAEAARDTAAEGARLAIHTATDIHDPSAQDILLLSVELETTE